MVFAELAWIKGINLDLQNRKTTNADALDGRFALMTDTRRSVNHDLFAQLDRELGKKLALHISNIGTRIKDEVVGTFAVERDLHDGKAIDYPHAIPI